MIRNILVILFMVGCQSVFAQAGVPISQLPTYSGNLSGSWIPVVVGNSTRKADAGIIGYNHFDSVVIYYGTSVDTFKFINKITGSFFLKLYVKATPVGYPVGGRLAGTLPNPTLANTAVTPGTYANATITVQSDGTLTFASTGSAVGGRLAGTLPNPTLANTAVTPGTYTNATVTVSADGTISFASTGAAGSSDSIIRTVSANTTALITDKAILCNTASGNMNITCNPAAVKKVIIIKTTSDFNTVTITPSSGLINGLSSFVITGTYQSQTIISDGTNYFIL